MNNYLIEILPIVLFFIFVYKIRLVTPMSDFNSNYLSINSGKYYRGFFAIVVVFHHLSQRTESGYLFRVFSWVGYLAVAYFFFLSGYGLQKSYIVKKDNYRKRFLLRRIPSVLFPYIIINILYWVMQGFIGSYYSLKDILIGIINGNPMVSFSWYIINILIYYIFYWILMMICKNHYNIQIICGCIWYILYAYLCLKMGYGNWWYDTSQLLIVGMIFSTYEEKIVNLFKRRFVIIAPIVLLLFAGTFAGKMMFKKIDSDSMSLLFSVLSAIFFVLVVIIFSMKIQIGNKILEFLGEISLEIYLVQGLFISVLRNNIVYVENELLWCIMVIIGTVFLSYVLHILSKFILKRYQELLK